MPQGKTLYIYICTTCRHITNIFTFVFVCSVCVFLACDNCIEFDVGSIAFMVAGEVIAMLAIGVGVHLVASHTGSAPAQTTSNYLCLWICTTTVICHFMIMCSQDVKSDMKKIIIYIYKTTTPQTILMIFTKFALKYFRISFDLE